MGRFRCRRFRRRFSRLLTCCVRGEATDRDSERTVSPEPRTPSPSLSVPIDIPLTDAVTEVESADAVNDAATVDDSNSTADNEGQSVAIVNVNDCQSITSVDSNTTTVHDTSAVESATHYSEEEIERVVELFAASVLERVIAMDEENGPTAVPIEHDVVPEEETQVVDDVAQNVIRPPSDVGDVTEIASNPMAQAGPEEPETIATDEDAEGSIPTDPAECGDNENTLSNLQTTTADAVSGAKCISLDAEEIGNFISTANETLSEDERETLLSILNDGRYDVAPEDHKALHCIIASESSEGDGCGDGTLPHVPENIDPDQNIGVNGKTSETAGVTDSGICCSAYSMTKCSDSCWDLQFASSDMTAEDSSAVSVSQLPLKQSPAADMLLVKDQLTGDSTESEQTDIPRFPSLTSLSFPESDSATSLASCQSSEEQRVGVIDSNRAVCSEDETVSPISDIEQGGEKVQNTTECDLSAGESGQTNSTHGQRSRHVFEVRLVCALLGLGLTLGTDDFKDIVIQNIRMFSPAATQGDLKVGDRILKINDTSVIGKSPSQVQRQLSGVKWGEEVKILAMPPQEMVAFHFSELANGGVIMIKLNTAFDKPLGIDVEGGSDTDSPYICISYIKPGSIADKCGMLRVGDELVQIDQHLMVGISHFEAIDILGHIYKPITVAVQRRQNLNIMDRIGHTERKCLQ